jgi:hypothetical protein
MAEAWRTFRRTALWVQVVAWTLVGFVALGVLGAVTGAGDTKNASATTSTTTSTTQPPSTTTERTFLLHPTANLTPGATFADVTTGQVCVVGYSESVRAVSDDLRNQVFAEYGMSDVNHEDFEVDHLIPLELGGSNDLTNLWPEPLHDTGGNGAVDKDSIENQLHRLVCSGEVSLPDAQTAIVHWDTVNVASLVTTTTATTVPPTTAPPVTQPPVTAPPTTSGGGGSVYYANCSAARAAGAAPILRGEPGYRPALDRDGDGVACE